MRVDPQYARKHKALSRVAAAVLKPPATGEYINLSRWLRLEDDPQYRHALNPLQDEKPAV